MKAAAFALAAAFMYMVMNMTVKQVSAVHDPVEAAFYRNGIAFVCVLLFLAVTRQWAQVRTANLRGQIIRALIGNVGLLTAFSAFSLLPIADATAIIFTAPLFVVLLSMPLLKEKVGPYRLLGTVFGFCGLLFILQPGAGGWSWGIAAALAAGVSNALVVIALRQLGKKDEAITTVFYFMLIGTLLTGTAMPFFYTPPTSETLGFLFLIGAAGFVMQMCSTQSYRLGEASMVVPFIYTRFIWAVLFGVLVFGDWPDSMIWAGAMIIIASNLFILWREHRVKNV